MPKLSPEITQEYLIGLIAYDRATGIFTWKVKKSSTCDIGEEVGQLDRHGYRYVTIDQKKYWLHRLAWFYVHGEWPPGEIDHINMVALDNRISNLRLVEGRWQQRANQKKRQDSRQRFKGIKPYGKLWMARCTKNGIVKYKYGLATPEEAHIAYLEMATKSFGEFARSA